MAIKVLVGEHAWRGFLRRAKTAFPTEHVEALWGTETIDSFRITDFVRMKVNKATSTTIDYSNAELKRQKREAEKNGKTFLGTVHTHPYSTCDPSGSTLDHHEAAKDGERVMGIVVLYKKDGRFKVQSEWWIPQPKIEFELLP